jgi:hypothetical protein
MSIAKKGSRKITVNGINYRWLVSRRYKQISDWHVDTEVLDEKFVEIAQRFGLGEVADVVFTIVIELYDTPQSKIVANYFDIIVDGFIGPEQFAQIKPKLISELIKQAINNAWNPRVKGDYKLEIFEKSGEKHKPVILALPNLNTDVLDYDNLVKLIKIL